MRDDGRFNQSHVIVTETGSEASRLWLDPATAVASGDMETHLSFGPSTTQ